MARLIAADELYKFLTDQLVKETGMFSKGVNKGINIARSAVKNPDAIPTFTPSNDPLTLEQLRKMDRFSPPIYDICLNEWCCVREDACAGDIGVSYIGGGTRPLEENRFYPYPLPHIDREAWEPCEVCNGKTTLYQHTNDTKLFMNTFGRAATLVTECVPCPPYADCCMKGISDNSAFKINFCPECGRPLTDEAVEMVMERLEALYENIHND